MTTLSGALTTSSLTSVLGGLIPSGVIALKDIAIAFIGDSYANAIAANATNRDALTDALISAGAESAITGDIAQAGANLTENDTDNLWNLSTSSKGALYTSLIDPFASKDTYNVGVLSIGTNDRFFLPDTTTESEFKTGFQELLNQLKVDFPSVVYWMIYPAYRDNAAGNETGLNIVRRVQQEIVSENADCYILPESYDYTAQDDLHIDNASETIYGSTRIAPRIASISNLGGDSLLCPDVSSIEVTDAGMELIISHKDGSDITVPATTSPEMFYANTEFTLFGGVLDVTGYDVERLSSSKIRLNCGALTGVSVCGVGGSMTGLTSTGIAPVVPYDNSNAELPIQPCSLIPSDDNVIRKLGNIQAMTEAGYTKTFGTGNDIDSIQGVNGRVFDRAFTSFPEFDASKFNGQGGIVTSSVTERLITSINFQENMMMGGVVEIPLTPSSNCDVMLGGLNGTSGSNNVNLKVLAGNGELRYYDQQSGAVINFGGDYRGTSFSWIIHYKTASTVDFYINSPTPIAVDQDVSDDYISRNRFILGGGGTIHGIGWMKYGSMDGNFTIEDALSYMNTKYL